MVALIVDWLKSEITSLSEPDESAAASYTRVSVPEPREMVSRPPSPSILSEPSPPVMLSLPAPP